MVSYCLYHYRCLFLSITLGIIFYSLTFHNLLNPLTFHDCLNRLPFLLQLYVSCSLSFCLVVALVWTYYFIWCGLVTWFSSGFITSIFPLLGYRLGVNSSLSCLTLLHLLLTFHYCSVIDLL